MLATVAFTFWGVLTGSWVSLGVPGVLPVKHYIYVKSINSSLQITTLWIDGNINKYRMFGAEVEDCRVSWPQLSHWEVPLSCYCWRSAPASPTVCPNASAVPSASRSVCQCVDLRVCPEAGVCLPVCPDGAADVCAWLWWGSPCAWTGCGGKRWRGWRRSRQRWGALLSWRPPLLP